VFSFYKEHMLMVESYLCPHVYQPQITLETHEIFTKFHANNIPHGANPPLYS